MQAIQGNKDAISTLSNTLSCDINAVQTALNTINTSVSQIACDTKLASCEVINAITSGNANLASQLANCCCQTQRSIDSVNLNLTQMNADNRLSICQQTNTLQNAITGGFNNLMTDNASKFNVIGAKIDAQTQMINDKFCQLEAQVEAPIITNTIDNSKEINDLKNDVADIRKMIEDTKKMFMGGFPKPPMPPMPNVPAPMK